MFETWHGLQSIGLNAEVLEPSEQVSGRESKEREKEDSHRLVGYFLSFQFLDEEPEELNDGYAAAVTSMMLVMMMDESGQLILGRGAGSRSRGGGDAGS